MADISIIKPKVEKYTDPISRALSVARTPEALAAEAIRTQAPALPSDHAYGPFTTKTIPIINPQEKQSGCECGMGPHCDGLIQRGSSWGCGYDGWNACNKSERKCLVQDPGWETLYCPAYGPVLTVPETDGFTLKCTYQYIDPGKVFDLETLPKDFDPATVEGYRKKYCLSIKNPGDLSKNVADCKEFFGSGTDEEFDKRILDLCAAAGSETWAGIPVCVETARRAVQNNRSNAVAGSRLMNAFCRGSANPDDKTSMSGHRSDERCACINARDLGFKGDKSCLSEANRSLPGCSTMYSKMKILVESGGTQGLAAIQSITTDAGCISEDCDKAKMPDDTFHIFPYQGGTECPSVDFNICDITVSQKVAVNSAVKAECNFPSDSNGGDGGGSSTPGAAPGMAPIDDGGLPITWKPFARIFNTETKQYAVMSSCCLACILLVVFMIFMLKPSGPSSQNLLMSKLASI